VSVIDLTVCMPIREAKVIERMIVKLNLPNLLQRLVVLCAWKRLNPLLTPLTERNTHYYVQLILSSSEKAHLVFSHARALIGVSSSFGR
jgi:hypothetical protein